MMDLYETSASASASDATLTALAAHGSAPGTNCLVTLLVAASSKSLV